MSQNQGDRSASTTATPTTAPTIETVSGWPGLTCVVIGKNEGDHLRSCLASIRAADYPGEIEIVYVDSASTDDSVDVARRFADLVVVAELPASLPGLARNLGWLRARFDLVHFIDGDTIVDPAWFRAAVEALQADARIFGVFGRLVETRPEANLFHRAYAFEWATPAPGGTGEPRTSGGLVLVRKRDIEAMGGFDPTLEAGEEPDLCTRARLRGRTLRYLDRPMAQHDMDMNSPGAWWRRGVRSGVAYAVIADRFRRTPIPLWRTEVRHNLMQLGVGLAGLAVAVGFLGPARAAAVVLAGFVLLVARKWAQARRAGCDGQTALAYALHIYLVKLPTWLGHIRYFARCLVSGRRAPRRNDPVQPAVGATIRAIWMPGRVQD